MEWFQLDPTIYADNVIGAQMCVWQMPPTDTLCMLSSRLPAMAERVWNPWSTRTFDDYSSRVTATGALLDKLIQGGGGTGGGGGGLPTPPPPGPPTPPGPPIPGVPGFESGAKGACRDGNGHCGKYLFTYGVDHKGVPLAQCADMCVTLGDKCDAYDYSSDWCGLWGLNLTAADSRTDAHGASWKFTTCNGGAGSDSVAVCQADPPAGENNTCFLRTGSKCAPPPPPPPPPAAEPGCLRGCSCL